MDCFQALGTKGASKKGARHAAWRSLDKNGNNMCSLAEVDSWIQDVLKDCYPEDDDYLMIWKRYRPCYIRAFNDANDIAEPKGLKGATTTTTDSYVTKREFRGLCAYLCIYAAMFDCFSRIDGKVPSGDDSFVGIEVTADDDRRMSLDEWVAGFEQVKGKYGFAAVGALGTEDPAEVFAAMDADGKGMVLLKEWCAWLEAGEIAAETEIGKALSAGDADPADPHVEEMPPPEPAEGAPEDAPPPVSCAPLKKFQALFTVLGQKGREFLGVRAVAWRSVDYNGNGMCSLAEVDSWVKNLLYGAYGEEGNDIWRQYRPCYIRAFNDAKDVCDPKGLKGATTTTTDSYVTKREFRVLCGYLNIYAAMFGCFSVLDGKIPSGDDEFVGKEVTADDDRRISCDEWCANYWATKGRYGFAAFAGIEATDPAEIFAVMDADGKGMVLLNEWCAWIEAGEIAAETPWGKILTIGDD
jgi:hypothetical protein